MRDRLGHKMTLGWLAAMLFLLAGNAQAVSLGKIEVASHLGEPFYAEVPLSLGGNESISRVFVEVAAPTDYRILEVYRDSILNSVRADVESDSRGTRIELSSRNGLDTPFFNLVLKVRYDRATHFKKYPIFLDLPKSIQPTAKKMPLPTVHALKSPTGVDTSLPAAPMDQPAAVSEVMQPAAQAESAPSGFAPYDGWARSGRYGPMVYGDTISTVAERLRVDDTFSRQQVMVALFEKNRAKFDQDNINVIKAGTYLDVPQAAEVERIAPSQARNVIAEHEKRWKELKKQPRYAAVAEAQKNRYSKRVGMGNQANGVAAAPESTGNAEGQNQPSPADQENGDASDMAPNQAASAGMDQAGTGTAESTSVELAALKQQNEALQARLAENERQLEALKNKPASEDAAAAGARVAKLELKLARLQAELDTAREQSMQQETAGSNWLTWLLGGLIVVLLGVVGIVMRREPAHPATASQNFETPESVASAASAESAAASGSIPEDDIPEIEVEEADVEALAGDIDATTQMTEEEARAFTDSIPDLTDEDTGQMPAFTEETEDEPDPNVDYLSEADVYMRYGMEEEAIQQVNMALRLKPDSTEAHIKKAEIMNAKGAGSEFEATIAEATQTLDGSDLERFNEAIKELNAGGESDGGDVSLEDTMPPTGISELISEQVASDDSISSEETISGDEVSDFGFGDAEMDTSGGADSDDTIIDASSAGEEKDLDEAMSDLDDLDLGEADESEASEAVEIPPAMDTATEEPVAEDQSAEAAADVSLEASSDGLDFDLSDIELPESEDEATAESGGPQMETADLDKTVAMDWSKDTSIDSDEFDLMGESGADQPEFESEDEPVAEEPAAEETVSETAEPVLEEVEEIEVGEGETAVEEITLGDDTVGLESDEQSDSQEAESSQDETAASLDLGDGDLDAGFDATEGEVEPADDFTSTIRTSLDEVGGESDDFTATGEHDLQFNIDASEDMDESMLEQVSEEGKEPAQKAEDEAEGGITLDLEEDADATQKLDTLLSQFSDDEEDKKD